MNIFAFILSKTPAPIALWCFKKIYGKKNIGTFNKILEIHKWEQIAYSPNEKWICKEDNSFTIEISSDLRDFAEEWTSHFPDKKSSVVEVYLKINNELVTKPIFFVYTDGCRNFVPRPEISSAYDQRYFYYDKTSIYYKVFSKIGFVDYPLDSLESFSKRCSIFIN